MGRLMFNGKCYSGGKFLISPECYSTEEREIGCWTDGKPLYQRTFEFQQTWVSGNNTLSLGLPSSYTIVAKELVLVDNETPPVMLFEGSQWEVVNVNNDRIVVDLTSPLVPYVSKIIATLRYTKSTDTPGSGQWTPQGIPAVHYSTNEHIVGTWIDGRTLYECTYHFENMGTSTHHYLYEYPGETGWVKNALVQRRQGNEWHSAPWTYWDNQSFISVHCYPYIIAIDIGPSSEYANEAYVTVCYVKPAS